MTLKDALLKEFDLELPYTRRSLERVPLEKFDWKPHEKSMTLGWLATFLALVPTWGNMVIELEDFDIRAASAGRRPEMPKTRDELLAIFDQNYGKFRDALAGTSDAAPANQLDDPERRRDLVHATAVARAARVHPEPHRPSPRAAWHLPANARYPGASHLQRLRR